MSALVVVLYVVGVLGIGAACWYDAQRKGGGWR